MFKASPARSRCVATLLGLLAGMPFAAQAQAYKCLQANGSIGYQGTPCASADKPSAHPTAAELNAQRAAAPPKPSKPYEDPYASSLASRPHPVMPRQAQAAPAPVARAPAATAPSSLAADVQARNKLEIKNAEQREAHKNDPSPERQANCQTARHNVNVLNEQRPVYTYAENGDHNYIADKDRAQAMADAQRLVAQFCN
jgi:hypothetical protein